jgi:hypothetical protein
MSFCINCGKEFEPNQQYCTNCGTSITGEIPKSIQTTPRSNVDQAESVYRFKTLLGYAKTISGLGWLIIGSGGTCLLIALYLLSLKSGGFWFGFLIAAGSLVVLGIPFVVSGQLISCFVEIEKNTRLTYQILSSR